MTLERLAQLAAHPTIAAILATAPLCSQTALTIHHAAQLGLLSPAEAAQYADLPRPWIAQARSTVSGMADSDLAGLAPESIAMAVAATFGAPERWQEVMPLVVRRQDVLAKDGYHAPRA